MRMRRDISIWLVAMTPKIWNIKERAISFAQEVSKTELIELIKRQTAAAIWIAAPHLYAQIVVANVWAATS